MQYNSFKIILKNHFHAEYVYQKLDFRKMAPLLFVPRTKGCHVNTLVDLWQDWNERKEESFVSV